MKLIITDAASQWFRDEMGLESGNGIKFYGKLMVKPKSIMVFHKDSLVKIHQLIQF